MAAPPRILLVEDDPAIGRTVAFALEREGFAVEHVLLVQEARRRLAAARPGDTPALLILDIGLPDGSGLDLCRALREGVPPAAAMAAAPDPPAALRAHHALPILILSARSEEIDRVLGLELGADDYLAKPFSPRELVARVRALLRRASLMAAPAPASGFEHDEAGQRIALHGQWLALTRLEYRLLAQLLKSPGRILPRERLLALVWGEQADAGDRTVDTHVKTLRAKLREVQPVGEVIVTHRGLGYSLQLPVTPTTPTTPQRPAGAGAG
jgi:two-component system catabolic regulation response regulator CreB